MHMLLLWAAYIALLLAGVLHFVIDVVAPYMRGQRPSGSVTRLHYGLHTAYALGLSMYALLALLILWSGSGLLNHLLGQSLSIVGVIGWFAICFLFIDYVPPKVNMVVVLALLSGAALTA